MPIIASLIKIAALSLALLCVDIKPMSAPTETAGVSKARVAASTANNERSSH